VDARVPATLAVALLGMLTVLVKDDVALDALWSPVTLAILALFVLSCLVYWVWRG
jgi:hypothetical protein